MKATSSFPAILLEIDTRDPISLPLSVYHYRGQRSSLALLAKKLLVPNAISFFFFFFDFFEIFSNDFRSERTKSKPPSAIPVE